MTRDLDKQIARLEGSKNLPAHIAIIMDGNGRWARKRNLPRLAGHRASRESVRSVVRTAAGVGISYLTLYAFSLENWQRPRTEVAGLMRFFKKILKEERKELDDNGVQLRAIGRLDMLPAGTREELNRTIEKLGHNDRMVLTLAISYGGRAEILDTVNRLARDVRDGEIEPGEIEEDTFAGRLYDPSLPDPDLLIRTSGEMRISNFLLWQIAYSEIYVTSKLWPDFRGTDLLDSIREYQGRERRFGLIT